VKNKSTKKKYLCRDKDTAGDSDEEGMTGPTDGVFMSCVEIADQLQHEPSLAECSPEFTDAIASHLYRYIRQLYLFSLWRFSLQKTGFVFSWFYHCFGISYGFQKLHKTLCLVKSSTVQ